MTYASAEGARLNTMLGKKTFRSGTIEDHEVMEATGLTINELIMCWIFDPRNNFQKVLSEWREDGKPMDFEEIQGY